jgi:RHS repeat-associated protein
MVRAGDETDNFGWKKFRSENYGGASTDPELEVTYNSYPTGVTNRSPAGGTISTDTTPTFSAVYNDPDAGDVGHVDYQVCSNATCSAVVLNGSGTGGVQPGNPSPWTVPSGSALTSGTEYWWRARSDDGRVQSSWSSIWKYTPNQPPPTPTLVTPMNDAEVPMITPVLRATDGDADPVHDADGQALSYEFVLDDNPDFQTPLCTSGWLPTTNTWTSPAGDCGLEDGVAYYWRARAKDPHQTSAWSGSQSFHVSLVMLGAGGLWPKWSLRALSVNLISGNLVVSLPGPAYETGVGSMGAMLTYNSLDATDKGLGPGWTLNAGAEAPSSPSHLIDHGLMDHEDGYDAVEVVLSGGAPAFYTHVGDSNTYLSEPGDSSRLTRNENGTWTLVDLEGSIYTFGVTDEDTFTATIASVELVGAVPGESRLTFEFPSDPQTPEEDRAKITSITDPAGRELVFDWNRLNPTQCPAAILCITGPDGVEWQYAGDAEGGASGRLVTINNGTRDLFAVTYEGPSSQIVKLQNANDLDPTNASPGYDADHAIEVAYDASDRVAEVTEGPITGQTPAISTWSFGYFPGAVTTPRTSRSADGYATVTPPRQQGQATPASRKSYYDALGREIELEDPLGNVTAKGYNESDQEIWSEDEEGNRTDFSWDQDHGVLLSTTGPDPDGGGPLGRPVTTYRYDEEVPGTPSAAGAALEGLQANYYTNASLAGRPGIRKNESAIDFSAGGGWPNLPGGQTTNFSVRWSGNVIVPTAGDYTFTTVATDGTRLTVGDVHAIEAADRIGAATTLSSQPISLTAGQHRIVLEYFAKTTSGPEVELRWNCAGGCPPSQVIPSSVLRPVWMNQTSVVSPGGKVSFTHFADPASGRPDYELMKLGSTNLITSYEYDSAGRVIRKVTPRGNAARSIDSGGNLTGSPDLDYATTWEYYGLAETAEPPSPCVGDEVTQAGLLKSMTRAGIAAATNVYDDAGRAVAVTSGSGTICDTYDSEGRVVSSSAPTAYGGTTYETITHEYDPLGTLLTTSEGTDATFFEYDEAGRTRLETDSFGSEIGYKYDSEGNIIERSTTPSTSSPTYTTQYSYDAAGQPTQLTDPAGREYRFAFSELGELTAVQYPNGTFAWMDYNNAGLLTAVYNRHGTLPTPLPANVPADSDPILDLAYTYDIEGRQIDEVRSGGGLSTETTEYDYDDIGRLAEVILPGGTCRKYLFDLNSNRTETKEGSSCASVSTVETYSYSTTALDQLTTVTEPNQSAMAVTYEAGGEVATLGSDELVWDGRGRNLGGTFDSTTVTYDLDPQGVPRTRTAGSQTTRFVNGGLHETDGSGLITQSAVDGPEGDLAAYAGAPGTSSPVAFLYYDGRGNLVADADISGDRVSSYAYDPFGEVVAGALPASSSFEGFVGKWDKKLDTASGLVSMGARPYAPQLGRFLAVDPIEAGSANPYDYAWQDPINNADPSGLAGCTFSPDRLPGIFNFRYSCDQHNYCYDFNWYAWRIQCDVWFHMNMRGQCYQQHRAWWDFARRGTCYSFAW